MKRRTLTFLLTLITVGLIAQANIAQAVTPEYDINEEDHYVRVFLPEENMDQVHLDYWKNGEEITAYPDDGEVVSVSITDNMLNQLEFPFAAIFVPDNDNFVFWIGNAGPTALKPVIGFQSTLEATFIDKFSTLALHAPGATAEVVQVGDIEQEIAPDDTWPMPINEEGKIFNMDGILKIKFFVVPAEEEVPQEEPGVEEEGPQEENGADPSLQDPLVEGPTSGGCSIGLAGTSSPLLGGLTLLLLPAWGILRRKVK